MSRHSMKTILVLLLSSVAIADDWVVTNNPRNWLPTSDAIQVGPYWASLDGQKGSSRYVVEILTTNSLRETGTGRYTGSFFYSGLLPKEVEISSRDYLNSKKDRGHLAASANHHLSPQDQKATFALINVAPQARKANRVPWKAIEQEVREDIERFPDGYGVVITAPLYIPEKGAKSLTIKLIGKNQVWVPTHYGKAMIIFKEGRPAEYRSGMKPVLTKCWILDNTETPPTPEEARTTINRFEDTLGMDIFQILDDEIEDEVEKSQ